MSHTPSRWKLYRAKMTSDFARQIADERVAEVERFEAMAVMAQFNARVAANELVLAWPTIGAALKSGMHWLHVHCPACDTVGVVDLRVVPRPAETILRDVLPKLACRTCGKAAASPSIVACQAE